MTVGGLVTGAYAAPPTLRYNLIAVPLASVLVPEIVRLFVAIELVIIGAKDNEAGNVLPLTILVKVVAGKLVIAACNAAKILPP